MFFFFENMFEDVCEGFNHDEDMYIVVYGRRNLVIMFLGGRRQRLASRTHAPNFACAKLGACAYTFL